jgi:3D (Asp-Asp-Asp) domain-containing protein
MARGYRIVPLVVVFVAWSCRPSAPPSASAPAPSPRAGALSTSFEATAYSIEGETASGRTSREGIVAADSKVLPIGSRIRVQGAGRYDGKYTVADTGREIKGREIDIYIANDREAKRFGRKKVRVEVLERGDGQRSNAR